jgi:hypothetical protein
MGISKLQKCKFEVLCYPESTLLFAVVVLVSEACVVTVQCQKIFCYYVQNYCYILILCICSSNLQLGTTDGRSCIFYHTEMFLF